MDNQNWKYLIEKYVDNSITVDELNQLLQMAEKYQGQTEESGILRAHWDQLKLSNKRSDKDWDSKFADLLKEAGQQAPVIKMANRRSWWPGISAAAALIVIMIGTYFITQYQPRNEVAVTQKGQFKNDVVPGGNKAILTLADGTIMTLDSAANGTLTQQGNTKVIKLDDGRLAYNAADASGEMIYNTISTPRGGQYQVTLADGTKVWLNAASSLKFPAIFIGKERNVELTGEGYFEVAKNAAMPFKVKVNDASIEVLGTHFNINSYDDEATMNTTLLEGSVRVSKGDAISTLKPGQQAQLNNNSIKIINNVNVDEALAWKNGLFSFKGSDIKTVMRQIARWYDVDVVFEGNIHELFHIEVSRNTNASNVFKILQTTGGVHFKIEGKKVIVMP